MKQSTTPLIESASSTGSASLLYQLTQALTDKWGQGPQNDDELHAYIKETFGYHIPRIAVCEGHQAPFDFLADAYFERVANALVLANRAGGKTLDVAALNVMDTAFKEASVVDVAGSKQQAKRCYDYSKGFYRRDPGLMGKVESLLMSETRLRSGATYEILAGSATSVRSPHVPKLRMDEIEEMKEEVFTGALSIPISQEGILSQVTMTSTRHKAHGYMQMMLDEAVERDFKTYKWCVLEVMQPCGEDCKACPIQEDCEGKAKKSDGFRTYADTLQQFRLHDRDTWLSEWLCKKPAKHRRVYYEFDADIHVIDQAPGTLELWGCIDWGYDNPFVFVKFGVAPNDDKYALESQYRRHLTDSKLAKEMRELYPEITDVVADPSNPGGADEFKAVGFKVHSRQSKVMDGIRLIRKDLKPPEGKPKLYFVRGKTRELINEFESYEHKEGTDEPKKENDHGCFAAGTRIETSQGPLPIEKVKRGDSVLTRAGYRTVITSGMTDIAADVMRAAFSDGKVFIGTGNHPVFVEGKGYIELRALRYGDIISSCEKMLRRERLFPTTGFYSAAIQNRSAWNLGAILRRGSRTALMASSDCIKRSGRIITGRYQKAIIFITKMAIRLTMIQKTLDAYQSLNTLAITAKGNPILYLRRQDRLRLNGIDQKREGHFTARSESWHGRNVSGLRRPAITAGLTIKSRRQVHIPASARALVSQHTGETAGLMTRQSHVSFAGSNSPPIRISNSGSAPVHVLSVSPLRGKRPVYNLTVEGQHEYFANGTLVHNCDAVREWYSNNRMKKLASGGTLKKGSR